MKFNLKFTFLQALLLFLVIAASTSAIYGFVVRLDSVENSKIQLRKGDAAVWYLFHSGWAVKTSRTFLIFD